MRGRRRGPAQAGRGPGCRGIRSQSGVGIMATSYALKNAGPGAHCVAHVHAHVHVDVLSLSRVTCQCRPVDSFLSLTLYILTLDLGARDRLVCAADSGCPNRFESSALVF